MKSVRTLQRCGDASRKNPKRTTGTETKTEFQKRKDKTMTGFNRRILEMLGRLVVFSNSYPGLFQPNTAAAELMEQVQSAFRKLSELAASQASDKGAIKQVVNERG